MCEGNIDGLLFSLYPLFKVCNLNASTHVNTQRPKLWKGQEKDHIDSFKRENHIRTDESSDQKHLFI